MKIEMVFIPLSPVGTVIPYYLFSPTTTDRGTIRALNFAMDYFRDEKSFKDASGYEIDGMWYPRVTKILGIKAKPALYRYYAEAASYAEAQSNTQKSAEEGTLVHETVQKIMMGENPEIDPAIAPAITEVRKFLEDRNIQIEPDFIERRVIHHGERYAGTIDALALIDGKFGVMDIKTSQAIYRDYNLQTAAYMEPLERDVKNLQTRWILRIDQNKVCRECGATLRTKGGRDKIKLPYPKRNGVYPDDAHDWSDIRGIVELKEFPFWRGDYEAFLSAKKLWEWENEFWLKKIGYLKPF